MDLGNDSKTLGALMSLFSCKIMMHTIAREPDIAIFVEMMSTIQKSLIKFAIGFIWLFVGKFSQVFSKNCINISFFKGWIVAFHIVLGGDPDSSFQDIGSAISKVLTMFSGELGFESTFKVCDILSTVFIF